MATLPGMDTKALDYVAGRLAGTIDFYFWKGIACARAWPFGAEKMQSLPRQKSAYVFSQIAAMKGTAIAEAVAGWKYATRGTTWSWGDIVVSLGMAYYKEFAGIPPEILSLEYTFT